MVRIMGLSPIMVKESSCGAFGLRKETINGDFDR